MENFENKLIKVEKTLENIRGIFEKNKIISKLKDLDKALTAENFWKDKNKVKKLLKKKIFEIILKSFKETSTQISDLKDLYKLAQEEKNEDIIQECNLKIQSLLQKLSKMKSIVFYQEKTTI